MMALAFAGCSDSGKQSPSKPKVVASNFVLGSLAAELGGEDFTVLFPRDADGIDTPKNAALVLVTESKAPAWLSTSANKKRRLSVKDGATIAGFQPDQAIMLAEGIASGLKEVAPEGAAGRIASRLEETKKRIGLLDEQWKRALRTLSSADPPFIAIGADLKSWAAEHGATVTSISEAGDFMRTAKQTKAAHVLLSESMSASLRKEIRELGLTPMVLQRGLVALDEDGSFLDLMESNVTTLEAIMRRANLTPKKEKKPEVVNADAGKRSFHKDVMPMLETYCIDCHDEENEEGEVNFEVFASGRDAERDPDFWESVKMLIEMKEMPPRKRKKQPSDAERAKVIAWIDELSSRWDKGEFGRDPGRTTIRRLNKNEYNYTVRDLFGLRIRPGGDFPEDGGGEAGFDNNADALFLPSLLMENYVEAAGVIVQAVYADAGARNRYLLAAPSAEVPAAQAARKVLRYWASRAYRRPVDKDELDRLVEIFRKETGKKKRYAEAMRMPLLAILLSSNFLYRAEIEKGASEAYRVDAYDLASRLSYFLWSSMPDQELFNVAREGKLHEPEALEAQVRRMLKDERARSLSMHFAGQWFGWEDLRSVANPDEKRFPTFTMDLRIAMYRESSEFFHNLVVTDGSAYDLLDCDYTFLNERLARHYGIAGVSGSELRKVSLEDPNRGGVLGMGSVLTATSLPLRSSPAKRGAYVLGELLGTPPPEPPMNVEQLPEDDREIKSKTFREALVQHRQDPNCKACHEVIDPIGFGMEAFDPIGRWRTKQNGLPLDTAGVMPDGTKFGAPADLKNRLMERKDLFARNLANKLLSYALGRELSPYDRPAIAKITERILADNGRLNTAFLEVAKSYPFNYRKGDTTAAKRSKNKGRKR